MVAAAAALLVLALPPPLLLQGTLAAHRARARARARAPDLDPAVARSADPAPAPAAARRSIAVAAAAAVAGADVAGGTEAGVAADKADIAVAAAAAAAAAAASSHRPRSTAPRRTPGHSASPDPPPMLTAGRPAPRSSPGAGASLLCFASLGCICAVFRSDSVPLRRSHLRSAERASKRELAAAQSAVLADPGR